MHKYPNEIVLAIAAISENLRPIWLRTPIDSPRRHRPTCLRRCSNVRPQNCDTTSKQILKMTAIRMLFGNHK
jgi:hypothetical protein